MEGLDTMQEIDEIMLVSMIKLNNDLVEQLRDKGVKICSHNIAS
jgi:hypothetical protein